MKLPRLSMPSLAAVTLILIAAPGFYSSAFMPQDPGHLRGFVVGKDGVPLSGAEVSAYPEPFRLQERLDRAETQKDGSFLLENLRPGGYRIYVAAEGYLRQEYQDPSNTTSSDKSTVVQISANSSQQITIRMKHPEPPKGLLSGRITSDQGEPLMGMDVVALRRHYSAQGWMEYKAEAPVARTNDKGEYRMLVPVGDEYVVRAASASMEAIRSAIRQGLTVPASSPGRFSHSYYGGARDIARARRLTVAPGEEHRNVDVVLVRQKVHKITGRIVNRIGDTPFRVGLIGMIPKDADYVDGRLTDHETLYTRSNGTFEVLNVMAGTYWLITQVNEQPLTRAELPEDFSQMTLPHRAMALVHVVDADVDNVELTVSQPPRVSGTITLDGEKSLANSELANISLELRPFSAGRLENLPTRSRFTETPGGFVFDNLRVGEYLLSITGIPQDTYIESAKFEGKDALTGLLLLPDAGERSLSIVLGQGSRFQGVVVNAAGEHVQGAHVVLVPEESKRRDRYKTAQTGPNGQFDLRGIAPGNYKLFAVEPLESYEYFDPEFVRKTKAVDVNIPTVSTITVSLSNNP